MLVYQFNVLVHLGSDYLFVILSFFDNHLTNWKNSREKELEVKLQLNLLNADIRDVSAQHIQ